MTPVLRFAPSPNGELHLGHALSALFGHQMARRLGGRFLVRIEDIDITRCREEFVAGIFEDLAWLGISWEEPVLRQSQRFAEYGAAAQRLREMGLLYPCFATRTEIAAHARPGALDPDGAPLYPGLHKHLSEAEIAGRMAQGEPYALRIDMEKALAIAGQGSGASPLTFQDLGDNGQRTLVTAHPERWGDAVIVRKDTPASYHLAVIVDDAYQGVTHVVRGQDLFASTDLHRLLQVLLGLPEPLYQHHPLILNAEGQKLSKSARDTSLKSLRESGVTASEIRARLGFGGCQSA